MLVDQKLIYVRVYRNLVDRSVTILFSLHGYLVFSPTFYRSKGYLGGNHKESINFNGHVQGIVQLATNSHFHRQKRGQLHREPKYFAPKLIKAMLIKFAGLAPVTSDMDNLFQVNVLKD